jgi:hypothetical protein
MTQVQSKPKRSKSRPPERLDSQRSAEHMLREVAFVLELTRRVRTAIRAEKITDDGSWC